MEKMTRYEEVSQNWILVCGLCCNSCFSFSFCFLVKVTLIIYSFYSGNGSVKAKILHHACLRDSRGSNSYKPSVSFSNITVVIVGIEVNTTILFCDYFIFYNFMAAEISFICSLLFSPSDIHYLMWLYSCCKVNHR